MRVVTIVLSALAITACGAEQGQHEEIVSEISESAGQGVNAKPITLHEMSPEELAIFVESGHVTLIDVRTREEYDQGHIPGAQLMPLDQFNPSEIDLNPYMTVVLYCRSGRRSGIAAERMAEHTGEPAQHLKGGILA